MFPLPSHQQRLLVAGMSAVVFWAAMGYWLDCRREVPSPVGLGEPRPLQNASLK
jgi:hypothetical protein